MKSVWVTGSAVGSLQKVDSKLQWMLLFLSGKALSGSEAGGSLLFRWQPVATHLKPPELKFQRCPLFRACNTSKET